MNGHLMMPICFGLDVAVVKKNVTLVAQHFLSLIDKIKPANKRLSRIAQINWR